MREKPGYVILNALAKYTPNIKIHHIMLYDNTKSTICQVIIM